MVPDANAAVLRQGGRLPQGSAAISRCQDRRARHGPSIVGAVAGVRFARRGITSAAVVVGAVGWAVAAGASANSDAAPVASTITLVNSNPPETFAPPSPSAAPALSAQQAANAYAAALGDPSTTIPSNVSVSLGSVTIPVGPDCGSQCENGNTVSNGIAYSALNELAYGFSVPTCPQGSNLPADQCTRWLFLDANTGILIIEIGPVMPAAPTQSPSPSPSASVSG